MRRLASALLAVCGVLLSGVVSAQETARGSVYRIPVDGVIELGLAFYLIKKGLGSFSEPSYTLSATRSEAKQTVRWAAAQRAD